MSLRHRLLGLLSKSATCDAEFRVGDPPRTFRCHRAILAAGSPVFEAMFFGRVPQESPVTVPDAHPRGFDIMLRYLYSDAFIVEDEWEAVEAAYVSKKYMVPGLFEACEDYLLRRIGLSTEDVLSTLEVASFLEMRRLRGHCLRYVSRNARKVLSSPSFRRASLEVLRHVLSLDLLDIDSESEVIEAVWLWGKEQCRTRCSTEKVRQRTRPLLRHVRFLTMDARELSAVLARCQILDTSEEMALLWNVAMPRVGPPDVPPDICRESRTRSLRHSSKLRFPGQYRYDGSMTLRPIEKHRTQAEIRVTGHPVTVVGAVVAFRPVPCYARSLDIEISATNRSSRSESVVKSLLKDEGGQEEVQHLLLLDHYVVVEEREVACLTVTVSGEGVRLMQCAQETLSYDLGKSEVSVRFEGQGDTLFPMKELMIA